MPIKNYARVRLQLVAPDTTELWVDMSPWLQTLGLLGFRGRLILVDKTGNFSARIGVQTYAADPDTPATALNPSVGTGLGAVTTVSRNVFDFDPTNANNGDTGSGKDGCRVGILYKSTSGVARGEVILELHARYA